MYRAYLHLHGHRQAELKDVDRIGGRFFDGILLKAIFGVHYYFYYCICYYCYFIIIIIIFYFFTCHLLLYMFVGHQFSSKNVFCSPRNSNIVWMLDTGWARLM